MIGRDGLGVAALDSWVDGQSITAWQRGCDQSTVSHRSRLGDQRSTLRSTWDQQSVLRNERQVRQIWRFRKAVELGAHAVRWINPQVHRPLPSSWMVNPVEVSPTRDDPLALLRLRVLEARLAPGRWWRGSTAGSSA